MILVVLAVASAASAGSITVVAPIPVSGGGTISWDLDSAFVTEFFSGSNGTDSVSMSGSGELGPDGGMGFGVAGENGDFSGFAGINGIGSGFFSFNVGRSMTIFNPWTGAPLITADLIGYTTITNVTYTNPAVPELGFTETFSISSEVSSVPEPATAWLAFAAISVVGISLRRSRQSSIL